MGVEGIDAEELRQVLRRAGVCCEECGESDQMITESEPITRADLFTLGLSGGQESAQKRQKLLKALDLPEHLTAKTMLPVLNTLYTRDEFLALWEKLQKS